MCLITIVINANAQVIRQGNKPKTTTTYTTNETTNSGEPKSIAYNQVSKDVEFKRSMISLNIFEFVFTNISLSYDYFSKKGKSGFHIPFTFGIGGKPDQSQYPGNNNGLFIASQNRIFESGLHYNYYLVGQKKASPFIGIGFNVGAFNYWNYPAGYVPPTTTSSTTINTISPQVGTNFSGALFAGILFNPNELITFTLKTGFGFRKRTADVPNYVDYTQLYGLLELNLGFKF
jgi:hypothetical protein